MTETHGSRTSWSRWTPTPRGLRSLGLLDDADVHVAETLVRLGGDHHPEVVLAAALAVRAPRSGHVAVDLTDVGAVLDVEPEPIHDVAHETAGPPGSPDSEELASSEGIDWPEPVAWRRRLAASPIVHDLLDPDGAPDPTRPLVLDGMHLYLQRYWAYERLVADEILERTTAAPPGSSADDGASTDAVGPGQPSGVAATLLRGPGSDRQRAAVEVALHRRLTVLVGGPGTGKTTTVAALLAELLHRHDQRDGRADVRIALAAPTGKAAARLGEAFRSAAQQLPTDLAARLADVEASTIHRLLGSRPGGGTRHGRDRPLPHDVVIVDEASMVSLPLMARLLVALRPDARLVIVGDPGQLASVEAGAVLADLTGPAAGDPATRTGDPEPRTGLAASVVVLRHSRRFPDGSPLDRLARAVRAGDVDTALAVLADPAAADAPAGALDWVPEPADRRAAADRVRDLVVPTARDGVHAAEEGAATDALGALERVRLLCAHRLGPFGVSTWNRTTERWLELGGVSLDPWYPGRPVMVTVNDHRQGLANGDIGIAVRLDGRVVVAFPEVDGWRPVSPSRLDQTETVHALTIHKSQGSEFDHAVVVLPGAASRLATRELLYTAITRARRRVTVVGDPDQLAAAISRRTVRTSGLGRRLWSDRA